MQLYYKCYLQNEDHLNQLEKDIRAAQEAALEAVETDSIMTGTSANPDDYSLLGRLCSKNCKLGLYTSTLYVHYQTKTKKNLFH